MKKVLSSLILIFLVLFSTYGASKNLKREKQIIYEVLSTQYAGFEDMTKKSNKSKWNRPHEGFNEATTEYFALHYSKLRNIHNSLRQPGAQARLTDEVL